MASFRRPQGVRLTTGIEDVDRRLLLLSSREANKICRASINAGLTVLTREIRNQSASDSTYPQSDESRRRGHRSVARAMREVVGKRFKTTAKGSQQVTAKAGFGVAKKAAPVGTRSRSGVGLGANNAHWFALGTAERRTGFKSSGRKGGRVKQATGNTVTRAGRLKPFSAVRRAGSSIGAVGAKIHDEALKRTEQAVSELARQ